VLPKEWDPKSEASTWIAKGVVGVVVALVVGVVVVAVVVVGVVGVGAVAGAPDFDVCLIQYARHSVHTRSHARIDGQATWPMLLAQILSTL